jgi:hypothetical protein
MIIGTRRNSSEGLESLFEIKNNCWQENWKEVYLEIGTATTAGQRLQAFSNNASVYENN